MRTSTAVGTRDGLEAALLASWDRETLAVYADHLQAQGDPRGELIALDLELVNRSTPELVARRTSLMTGWLGRLVPSNPHTPWIGDSFRFGFVDDLVLEAEEDAATRLVQVLASPLAPYLKRVTIRGDIAHATEMLRGLATDDREHPWLTELGVKCSGAGPIDPEVVARWIAATPALHKLDVQGRDVFAQFPHAGLKRLRITGSHAIPGLYSAEGSPANVAELNLAFDQPYDAEAYDYNAPPPSPIEALELPALRTLDLSRNEPENLRRQAYQDPDVDYEPEDAGATPPVTALEVLAMQPLRTQLTHLKLPSLRSLQELERLEHIVGHMPALVEVEIKRAHYFKLPPKLATTKARFVRPAGWPWPRVSEIPHDDALHVLVPGSRSGDTVSLADAAAVMERRFEELDADARFAWTRFWAFVDELGKLPWKTDPHTTWTDERMFPASILVAGLETCEIGGSGGWRELRDELRFRRPFAADAMLTVHRVRRL